MTKYNLAGRTVAITGACGGLGSAIADELRRRRANLALLDLDGPRVDEQADRLGGPNVARGWSADVRDLASIENALAGAAEHFGRLDVVIANAGIEVVAPMSTADPTEFERAIDINLTGVWRTFRAALPHVEQHGGYLLAVSSMAAFVHSPLQASYTASKAGVWALCDSIRLEVEHLGVGVGSVHPTFFDTPMMDRVNSDPAGQILWNGNSRGIWRMVSRDTVVADTIRCIERRSDLVVVPRINTVIGRSPGVFRRSIERIGFRNDTVPRAIAAATR